jgi:hypothetical protein
VTKPSTIRFFEVQPNRVVVPPRDVIVGPGQRHMRFGAGEVLEVPTEKVNRFIRGRVAAGDLVEVKGPKPKPEPAPKAEPKPRDKELDLAAATRKEG